MLVLDASALVDLLLNRHPRAPQIVARVLAEAPNLHTPHLCDVEVAQVLRRFVLRGELDPSHAVAAIEDLADLPITRHSHSALLPRALDLRDVATVYDAVYIALAELLDAPLLTCDAALGRIHGLGVTVEVVT